MVYKGSCHCGSVTFEVKAPETLEALECNCSICARSGYLHLIVPLARFRLLKGREELKTYTFNTGMAKHYFCRTCGIKSFYVPRSNPDGMDINVNCLDTKPGSINIDQFDGRNWEDNAHTLSHLSRND